MTAVDPSGFLILACLAGLVVLLVAARAGRRPVERSEPAPAPDPAAGGVYFVTANVWLIAGLVLLLGGSTLYGYGRIEPFVYWGAVWAAFSAAAVCGRRWRAAGEVPKADGPSPGLRDAALVWLVGLLLLGGAFGWAFLRAAPGGHLHLDGSIAFAGLGLGWLGMFAAVLRIVRGRSPELLGFGGAAVCMGVVCLGVGFAVGESGGGIPSLAMLGFIGVALLGAVVLAAVGFAKAIRPARAAVPAAETAPATRPASGPPAASPFSAGLGFVALILAGTLGGLLALGVGVPAWQKSHPASLAGVTESVTAVGMLALFAILLFSLVGLLYTLRGRRPNAAGRRPDPQPEPPPSAVPTPPRDCPRCGQPIPAGSPQGLCPRCLLAGVMPSADRPSPTLAFVEAFVAPPVEDVAKLFPHLEVKELIGQGGMGAVYLARQTALDRPVALKLVRPREDDPTFAERFAREARALAKLSHPSVVTVYESGTAGGLPYLVMEYVDGVTLRDAMREKKLTPVAALAVVPQLCDALEYAHSQGVVHRDVKPENILLTRDGRVKIADFGLAKVADPAGVSLTGTRQAMGTPHYMAPEQWEKPGTVDHRADIYALGVVLYELLTGELPLGRFDPPSQKIKLDVRIDEVVLRALAKEPDRRYQHAGQVKSDLERIGSAAPGGWVRTGAFREYKSRRTFLGLPLVHVVFGRDPRTGQQRIASGWLAVGDGAAFGAVALAGGFAAGGIALAGGCSIGFLAMAGVALGVFAAGGAAIGGFVAVGGFAAAAGLAVGGAAVGRYAVGGSAAGTHVLSGERKDPDFAERLWEWVETVVDHLRPF